MIVRFINFQRLHQSDPSSPLSSSPNHDNENNFPKLEEAENFSHNQPSFVNSRENGKFRETNDLEENNDQLQHSVAMDSQANNNENGGEERKGREDTDDENRKERGANHPSQSSFSEAEEKGLLQLKRALFKHDQINEVPGEIVHTRVL